MSSSFFRHMKTCFRRPAQRLPSGFRSLAAQWFAMRSGSSLFGAAKTDLGPDGDQGRAFLVFPGQTDRFFDQAQIITVRHCQYLPAISLKPQAHILGKGDFSVSFDRNVIVIV